MTEFVKNNKMKATFWEAKKKSVFLDSIEKCIEEVKLHMEIKLNTLEQFLGVI